MHGPRAAEGDEREVARIAAALDRYHARRQLHVGVDDRVDAPRRVLERQAERARDSRLNRARRGARMELERAAGEILGIDVAQHHVGVGDRRLHAAAPVADRPRRRRRALRPDRDHAELGLRDRAAARADLDQVDRLDVHREPTAGRVVHAMELEGRRRRGPTLVDERKLGGRASHVEGDEIAVAGQLAVGGRHQGAGGGTGLDHANRIALHRLGRRDAARGLHHEEAAAVAPLAHRRREGAQVLAHDRHHVRVHDRGGRPLIFPERRRHLVRERDGQSGRFLFGDGGEAALVRRVQVRVQQAHRERRHASPRQRADRAPRVRLVEGRSHGAVGQDALGHLADEPARNQRRRLLDL